MLNEKADLSKLIFKNRSLWSLTPTLELYDGLDWRKLVCNSSDSLY